MIKDKRKIKFLLSVFISLLCVFAIFYRLSNSQVNLPNQDLEKNNPIVAYNVENVLSINDLLVIDMGQGPVHYFNNTNSKDPQYLGRWTIDYNINYYFNVDDVIYCLLHRRNDTDNKLYAYFTIYKINEDLSLEKVREYLLPSGYGLIIPKDNITLIMEFAEDSISLFNCTEVLEEIPIEFNYESFYPFNDSIVLAYYLDNYLCLGSRREMRENYTLAIFDMTNHTKPDFLRSMSFDSYYSLFLDISIVEERMYLINIDGYARVLNITENENIQEIGMFNTTVPSGTIRIAGNYALYLVDNKITVYNIADLENVEQLGSYKKDETQKPFYSFYVFEEIIYISFVTSSSAGILYMIDWSNPLNLVFIRTLGIPHTESTSFFIVTVPVVFIVIAFGLKKRRKNNY